MARVAKALGDPIRMQLVDVLRKHAGTVCVCELFPLFGLRDSRHLRRYLEAYTLNSSGVLDRRTI